MRETLEEHEERRADLIHHAELRACLHRFNWLLRVGGCVALAGLLVPTELAAVFPVVCADATSTFSQLTAAGLMAMILGMSWWTSKRMSEVDSHLAELVMGEGWL